MPYSYIMLKCTDNRKNFPYIVDSFAKIIELKLHKSIQKSIWISNAITFEKHLNVYVFLAKKCI